VLSAPVLVHGLLASAVAAQVVFEVERTRSGSSLWLLDSAVVALAALLFAWWRQEQLRLGPLVAIALAFQVALLWAHLRLGAHGDQDARDVYAVYGNELLHRHHYPESEYPVGAVLLFALEAFLGGGATETANAFLMVPFQLVCVTSIWLLRTPYSAWLATLVAIWPMNAYYWEYRFDLVPAAFLALGLFLAWRGRWSSSGLTLGLGAAVKWTPGLTAAVLAVWLLGGRRLRDAGGFVGAFVAAVLVINAPFFLWAQRNVLAAYRQGSRAITNESIWYFVLRPMGLTKAGPEWQSSGAPHSADTMAVVVQLALLAVLVLFALLLRGQLDKALAVAALAPAVFLLTNKVFSVQFLVVLTTAWAFAAALVVATRREQLVVGLLMMAATFANAFVYPFHLPDGTEQWVPYSAIMFASALLATGVLLRRAAPARLTSRLGVAERPA
jgi:hypothetical protein